MNLSIKYTTGNDNYAIDTMKKIAELTYFISWKTLTGKVDEYGINLTMETRKKEIIIIGKYNYETECFPVHVWDNNSPIGIFNWHPCNSIGEFDLETFKNELKTFFNKHWQP